MLMLRIVPLLAIGALLQAEINEGWCQPQLAPSATDTAFEKPGTTPGPPPAPDTAQPAPLTFLIGENVEIEEPAPERGDRWCWFSGLDVSLLRTSMPSAGPKSATTLDWGPAAQVTVALLYQALSDGGVAGLLLSYRYVAGKDQPYPFNDSSTGARLLRDRLDAHFIDVTGTISFAPGSLWAMEPRLGLQFASIFLDSRTEDSLPTLSASSHFVGGGGGVGGVVTRKLGETGAALFFEGSCNWLIGSCTEAAQGLGGVASSQQATSQHGRVLEDPRIQAGVRWTLEGRALWVRLAAGYQYEEWLHWVRLPPAQFRYNGNGTVTTFGDQTDVRLHGPFVRCEIRY
jgi:hypothetical protein